MRTYTRTVFLVSLMAVSGGFVHGATTLQAAPDRQGKAATTAPIDRVRCWDGRLLEGRLVSESEDEVKIQLRFGLQCLDRDEVESIERDVTATPRRKAKPSDTAIIDPLSTRSAQPRLRSRHAERRQQPRRRNATHKKHRRLANREAASSRPTLTESEKINRQRLDLGFARATPTSHYVLLSNAPAKVTHYYGQLLESTYQKMGQIFSHDQDPGERLSVLIYSNHEEFTRETGKPAELGGYFDGQHLLFFHATQDTTRVRAVLLHHAAYQYLRLVLSWSEAHRSLVWLAEGLAVYLEPSQLASTRRRHNGTRVQLQTGLLPRSRHFDITQLKQDIRTNSNLSLSHLLYTPHEAFTGVHQAYAWSLLHFLLHHQGESNRKYLARLLEAASDGVSSDETLEKIFNTDLHTIESHWKRYVLELPM